MTELEKAKNIIRGLLRHADRNTCNHEETHRGGAIWEICDICGMKWADDEGGKPEYVDPPEIASARDYLTPPPEMEEFETKAFRCPSCMRLHETDANDCTCGNYCSQFIALTGTIKRPKKQPVERSVSVEAWWSICNTNVYPVSKSDFFDWQALIGKTGTLTFTYLEEQ